MEKRIKDKNLEEEVITQLRRSEVKKDKLIKDICKEYEVYLQIVRKSIYSSVKKGIFGIYSDLSLNDSALTSEDINNFIKENISLLIYSQLPLLTVEQLKLGDSYDYQKKFINLNFINQIEEFKECLSINFEYENNLITEDSPHFYCNNNSNTYEYYESLSEDKLLSINLDDSINQKFFSKLGNIKKIEQEKKLDISPLELIEATNQNKLKDYENINCLKSDNFIPSHNLNCFDLIDKSLNNIFLNLSYKINLELFKIKIIKEIISEDNFKILVNKNAIIKHPYPFVIRYDLNTNKFLANNGKYIDIYLFNITNIELEFYNLDLSICRNKINELKYKFKLLHKKQKYWNQKELTLNKINK